jgi:hypothetical protein
MLAICIVTILSGCSKEPASAPPAVAATPPAATAPVTMPEAHPTAKPSATVDMSGISTPAGGVTVADLFAQKDALAGKKVVVRGKVVKVAAAIMDRDWIHVRDGSGEDGKNDLTVTTKSQPRAKVGDTVLVTGVLSTNKDIGMGYKYDVIIEDGEVKIE